MIEICDKPARNPLIMGLGNLSEYFIIIIVSYFILISTHRDSFIETYCYRDSSFGKVTNG